MRVTLEHAVDEACNSDWCENKLRIEVRYFEGGHPTVVIDEHIDGTCNRAFDSGRDYNRQPEILQDKYETLVRRLNEIYQMVE